MRPCSGRSLKSSVDDFLDGDWDVAEGAAFPSFQGHTMWSNISSFHELAPHTCRRLRVLVAVVCSLGGAIDWDNNIWVYRELYVKHLTAEQLADKILEAEELDPLPHYTVLDSSCWNKTGFGLP